MQIYVLYKTVIIQFDYKFCLKWFVIDLFPLVKVDAKWPKQLYRVSLFVVGKGKEKKYSGSEKLRLEITPTDSRPRVLRTKV